MQNGDNTWAGGGILVKVLLIPEPRGICILIIVTFEHCQDTGMLNGYNTILIITV